MQRSNRHPGDNRPQSGSDSGNTTSPAGRILTIGHSNHSIDRFVALLIRAGVGTVADVRSSPFSPRLPQFNQPELDRAIIKAGMRYVFTGDELGGRPRDIAAYDRDGRVNYWHVRGTALFQAGIDQIIESAKAANVAMVCAEEDPIECHRALMVAPELVERGFDVGHLRGDGSTESTRQFENRLLDVTGVGGGIATGLFAGSISAAERAEMLLEAYRLQAKRKAFRMSEPGTSAPNSSQPPE